MTIYEELVQRVFDGETFYINFKNKSMKIGKKFVIADGVYDTERKLIDSNCNDVNAVLKQIESLYEDYKFSLPSERSDCKRRKYFKALSIEEISDGQLMTATRREEACARLEGFILCMILSNKLKWNENWGTFFWQSAKDGDLILLRGWIDGKN